MTIESMVTAIAGVFIMVTVALTQYHADWWMYVTAFIGFNLFQSSFTGFCPLAMILKALGFKSAAEKASEA